MGINCNKHQQNYIRLYLKLFFAHHWRGQAAYPFALCACSKCLCGGDVPIQKKFRGCDDTKKTFLWKNLPKKFQRSTFVQMFIWSRCLHPQKDQRLSRKVLISSNSNTGKTGVTCDRMLHLPFSKSMPMPAYASDPDQ